MESLASSIFKETQASLLLSVAVAILVGFICILALIGWWVLLLGVACGCSRGMVNLHITFLLDKMLESVYKIFDSTHLKWERERIFQIIWFKIY